MVEATWGGKKARFVVECKALTTPKAFLAGVNQLKAVPLCKGNVPHAFLPYLNDSRLQELEREGISGGRSLRQRCCRRARRIFHISHRREEPFSLLRPDQEYLPKEQFPGRTGFPAPRGLCRRSEIGAEINRLNLLVSRWGKKPMSLLHRLESAQNAGGGPDHLEKRDYSACAARQTPGCPRANFTHRPSGKGQAQGRG
jgi:hypothetical protein